MAKALFPIHVYATPAAAEALGPHWTAAAIKAFRAAILNGQGLAIAHQQITWGDKDVAFSVRVTVAGDVVIDFDIGSAALRDRVVLEDELRRSARTIRGISDDRKRSDRMGRRG